MQEKRLPENLRKRFEELMADQAAVQAKYANFAEAIHQEQKMLVLVAKDLWAEAINELGLEGQWRYKDGFLHPVDEKLEK